MPASTAGPSAARSTPRPPTPRAPTPAPGPAHAPRGGRPPGPAHALVPQVGIRSWRGNDDVLEAMTRVCHAAPHAPLLSAGGRPPRGPVLRDQASRRGRGRSVFVLGHREDIPEILSGSDLVVDASYAGLGLTGPLPHAPPAGAHVAAPRPAAR